VTTWGDSLYKLENILEQFDVMIGHRRKNTNSHKWDELVSLSSGCQC